ncbi:MAG: SPASM domain-containing protein [Bacteroidales bacterium]|nr:SPASM domain-containing protein [Bacteroidales bacterium]
MRFIHLLYVPTMACNMACRYCYLEDNTKDQMRDHKPLETLDFAVRKLRETDVVPFNISLHGGEVTTMASEDFENLVKYISEYYSENYDLLSDNGFKVGTPHIKTNLLSLDKHLAAIEKYKVSISGSLDLPLSLHDEYRLSKGGKKTLETILENVKKLSEINCKKKVSATIFKEHYDRIDEIISDINFLHEKTCLNMNDFNFMIGFDYNSNGLLHPLGEDDQVRFFERMHQEFDGTDLDKGVNGPWFNEFGPTYCTNCDNCGQKFFLLEKNGDIYSCVRGQKHKEFYYGNIYENSVEEILNNAEVKIMLAHGKVGFSEECAACRYLYLCKTGCPFVKNVYNSPKSYTCKLQQKLYGKQNYQPAKNPSADAVRYLGIMHPEMLENFEPKVFEENSLLDLIQKDPRLKYIYDSESFVLKVGDESFKLKSQILRNARKIIYIPLALGVKIYVRKEVLEAESDYPQNNALYIQLLSGDTHTYGDEQREKQKHVATLQVYKYVLETCQEGEFFVYDITNFLKEYAPFLSKERPNNIFFTTAHLRDYHYTKQKNNAYYHIAAVNLPFQNIEFNLLEDIQL